MGRKRVREPEYARAREQLEQIICKSFPSAVNEATSINDSDAIKRIENILVEVRPYMDTCNLYWFENERAPSDHSFDHQFGEMLLECHWVWGVSDFFHFDYHMQHDVWHKCPECGFTGFMIRFVSINQLIDCLYGRFYRGQIMKYVGYRWRYDKRTIVEKVILDLFYQCDGVETRSKKIIKLLSIKKGK